MNARTIMGDELMVELAENEEIQRIANMLFPQFHYNAQYRRYCGYDLVECLTEDWVICKYCIENAVDVLEDCLELLRHEDISALQKIWVEDRVLYIADKSAEYETIQNIAYEFLRNNNVVWEIVRKRPEKCIGFLSALIMRSAMNTDENCLNQVISIFSDIYERGVSVNRVEKSLDITFRKANFSHYTNEKEQLPKAKSFLKKAFESLKIAIDCDCRDEHNVESCAPLRACYLFIVELNRRIHDHEKLRMAGSYIKMLENGQIWVNEEDLPDKVYFEFEYPDGKYGDIYMYYGSEYGTIEQIDSIYYRATIGREHLDIIEYVFYNRIYPRPNNCDVFYQHYIPQHFIGELLDSMESKTRYYVDDQCVTQYGNTCGREEYEFIQNYYLKYIASRNEKLNAIYAKLVVEGKTTPHWKSEQKVFQIVSGMFTDAVYQYHCDWLGFQSLDVYIPSLQIGIEYQGVQHYEPISIFGGEDGLKTTQDRDKKKKQLCKKNGVRLIYWKYDEAISDEVLKKKIARYVK